MVNTEEVWKDIKGFEGLYQISSLGKIKALERLVTYKAIVRGIAITRTVRIKEKKKLLTNRSKNKDSYLVVVLCKGGIHYNRYGHRLVAEAFIPNPNDYEEVNHKNGIKYDNRIENLEWCSPVMNQLHAAQVLGRNCGEENVTSKLKMADVRMILIMGANGVNRSVIAKCFSVHKNTINKILRGDSWNHITKLK